MKRFLMFLREDAKQINAHMTHIEDGILYGAKDDVVNLLNKFIEQLTSQNGKEDTNLTIKVDGSPAVVCGIDPEDNRFFVAKKSIFNKNPKIYKTHKDIDDDTTGDLNKKMHVCFDELAKLDIKEIYQGDLLYTKNDLKKEKIDGIDYITYQPNTIVYAVQASSKEAERILKSKLGIVFHTKYTGNSIYDLKSSFTLSASDFKNIPEVYIQEQNIKNASQVVNFNKQELSEINALINKIKSKKINYSFTKNKDVLPMIETFNNSLVRNGKWYTRDTKAHVINLINFIKDKMDLEMSKRKTEKGKLSQRQKHEDIIKEIEYNSKHLEEIFETMNLVILVKIKLMSKFNEINNSKLFVRTKDGFKVTGQEGLVVSDKLGKNVYKLVDRLEFSRNNFSKDIIKGWER